jgi:hypothetical protein
MQQFIITEQTLRTLLKKAFSAGYSCPPDMMDSEIANIYNEYIAEHEPDRPNSKPPEIQPEPSLDSPEALKLLLEEITQKQLF